MLPHLKCQHRLHFLLVKNPIKSLWFSTSDFIAMRYAEWFSISLIIFLVFATRGIPETPVLQFWWKRWRSWWQRQRQRQRWLLSICHVWCSFVAEGIGGGFGTLGAVFLLVSSSGESGLVHKLSSAASTAGSLTMLWIIGFCGDQLLLLIEYCTFLQSADFLSAFWALREASWPFREAISCFSLIWKFSSTVSLIGLTTGWVWCSLQLLLAFLSIRSTNISDICRSDLPRNVKRCSPTMVASQQRTS